MHSTHADLASPFCGSLNTGIKYPHRFFTGTRYSAGLLPYDDSLESNASRIAREQELQANEKHYYETLAGALPKRYVVAYKGERELDTYIAGLSSTLVIHPGSTLGFELSAAGKKVIFGASFDPELIDMWGVQLYFDVLPRMVKPPANYGKKQFFELCDDLISCKERNYLLMSKDTAHSIVSMPEAMRPNEAIRKFISSMMQSSRFDQRQ